MALHLLTPPAAEPLTLAETKLHLRVDTTADDALIDGLIAAARHAAESYCAIALLTQTWLLRLDAFPAVALPWWDGGRDGAIGAVAASTIEIPRPPLVGVTSLTTYDDADTPSVMAAASYFVDTASRPGRLVLRGGASWPATHLRPAAGIEIEFVAGYGAGGAAVPWPLRRGLLTHVAWLYQHRGDSVPAPASECDPPAAAAALYRPYRVARL